MEEHHLTQIKIGHPLIAIVRETFMKIFGVKLDRVGHTLSVEAVHLLFILIVEAFVREILLGAVDYVFDWLLIFEDALVLSVIQEMVVGSRVVVEKGHKDGVIVDEAANDVGIREIIVAHSVVIESQSFVDLKFIFFDLLIGSRDLFEGPESKLSIVAVDTGICGT